MNILLPQTLNSDAVLAGFTTKDASFENDFSFQMTADKTRESKNLLALMQSLGLESSSFALTSQVHGKDILEVEEPGYYSGFDGLFTQKKDILIGVRVADCAALIFYHQECGIVGVAHAGWRGAVAGIHTEMIARFCEKGALASEIQCWISPCIGTQNFEVGEEVAAVFPEECVVREGFSKPHIDLKAFLVAGLLESGLQRNHIEVSNLCTVADNEQLFSHRAEDGKAGRTLAYAVLKK